MTEPSQYFKGRTVQEQMNEVIGYVDQRSAEVATAAIASDVAQVHQDMLDADADASAAAASAAAAAGTLANAVKKTGEASQSIAGDIAISGALSVSGAVTVPAPTGNTNAATKKYVDDQDALDVKLAGSQAITGAKTVPLEATGTFSNQIASSNKVKNELDNYAPMVRTTGNQNIAGLKTFTDQIRRVSPDWSYLELRATNANRHTIPSANIRMGGISFQDANGEAIVSLVVDLLTDGHINVLLEGMDSNEQYWNSVILNRQVIF